MLTEDEFADRMKRVERRIADLAEQPDDPAAMAAADLLRTVNELHAEGLKRLLAHVRSEDEGRPGLLEQFAQDDVIRSLLLCHGLHPIDLKTRVSEAVNNLRPLVESYGGRVSLANLDAEQVTLRLEISHSRGPSPATMLRELLEQAILVSAPDVAEVRFVDHAVPQEDLELRIINVP